MIRYVNRVLGKGERVVKGFEDHPGVFGPVLVVFVLEPDGCPFADNLHKPGVECLARRHGLQSRNQGAGRFLIPMQLPALMIESVKRLFSREFHVADRGPLDCFRQSPTPLLDSAK